MSDSLKLDPVMPPRWLSLAIITFWLSTTGWLVYHDVWPHLRSDQPPPFSVDLIDEVQARRPPALWTVRLNGAKVFQGRTRIEHPAPEVFELHAELISQTGCAPAEMFLFRIRRLESRYRVDPDGNLLGMDAEFQVQPTAELVPGNPKAEFTIRFQGEVANGVLRPTVEFLGPALPDRFKGPFRFRDVEVGRGGGLILAQHPFHRMRDLKPGQRWVLSMFDLGDTFQLFEGLGGGPRVLHARVLKEPQQLDQGRRQGISCLIVEMEGEDETFRIWVDEINGLVLRQEATLGRYHWVMDRD